MRTLPRPAACAAAVLFALASPAAAVDFSEDLDAALAANEARRPVVIVFDATWCGFCRKMASETLASEPVGAVAGDFVWVRVDIDEHPELAARYHAWGVPRTVVLNADGAEIGSRDGYVPADRFVAFLKSSVENTQTPESGVEDLVATLAAAASDDERREAVRGLVERLAGTERQGRDEALAAVASAGDAGRPVLLDLMADERLAVRAAAVQALRRSSGVDLPFQPFASADVRREQVDAWRDRLAAVTAAPSADR